MIGIYDYTVVLTYMSFVSAIGGITLAVARTPHPILASFCLLFCGLCDMFDGKIARTKKNRTEEEKAFGIQIDSLCDIVAFGVQPAVLAIALCGYRWYAYLVGSLFVLAGLIRLAYFNVTEEQRQKETEEVRKNYTGLPITASALIFPLFYSIVSVYCLCTEEITRFGRLFMQGNFRALLCVLMALTGILYITPFKMRKPRSRELWLILAVGLLVAAVLLLTHLRRLGVF